MARRIDPERKRCRDTAFTVLSFTRADTSALATATADLLTRTTMTTGHGHEIGDRMIWNADYGRQALERAASLLTQATEATRDIDITVEVPDDPPRR